MAVYTLPDDRCVDWSLAGVQGGIEQYQPGGMQQRTNLIDVVEKYGADNSGTTDSSTAINNAIRNCQSGDVIYLPTGNYVLSGKAVEFSKSNITIRGDGPGLTNVYLRSYYYEYNGQPTTATARFFIRGATGRTTFFKGPVVDLDSDGMQGDDFIKVVDTTGFNVGDLIWIDEENRWPVDNHCVWRQPSSQDREASGLRVKHQAALITEINRTTNIIKIDLPLASDFLQSADAKVCLCRKTEKSGIENLSIIEDGVPTSYSIWVFGASNCWLSNVHISNFRTYGALFQYGIHNEMFKCVISADPAKVTDKGWGIGVQTIQQTGIKIHNCAFHHLQWALHCGHASCYSVIAYNYFGENFSLYDKGTWLVHIIQANHDAWPYMNLFEGNFVPKWTINNYHGAGGQMTLFRNFIHGYQIDSVSGNEHTQMKWCCQIDAGTYGHNILGNVLGHPSTGPHNGWSYYERNGETLTMANSLIFRWGYASMGNSGNGCDECWCHTLSTRDTSIVYGNYDFYNNDIVLGDEDPLVLPDSLYLSEKPAWFGALPWPPVEPQTPLTLFTITETTSSFALSVIPAKFYVERGYWPDEEGTPPPPLTGVPCGPPVMYSATPSNDRITLSFANTATQVACPQSYTENMEIERSEDGVNYSEIGSPLSHAYQSYTDIGLSPSTTYHYRMKGENTIGYSEYSDPVSATTLADPGNLVHQVDTVVYVITGATIIDPFKKDDSSVYQVIQTILPNDTPGKMELTFEVTNPGNYYVWGNFTTHGGGSDSIYINIDDDPIFGNEWDLPDSTIQTWVSSYWLTVPKTWSLTPDNHTVKIWGREPGVEIHSIMLTNHITNVVGPSGPGLTVRDPSAMGLGDPNTATEGSFIDITCPTEGAVIYYTLDDSDPTEEDSDVVPEGGIEITKDCTLKLRAFLTDAIPSNIIVYDIKVRPKSVTNLQMKSIT